MTETFLAAAVEPFRDIDGLLEIHGIFDIDFAGEETWFTNYSEF